MSVHTQHYKTKTNDKHNKTGFRTVLQKKMTLLWIDVLIKRHFCGETTLL